MDNTADFDAVAFRMPPGESVTLDPQARIALEQTQVCYVYCNYCMALDSIGHFSHAHRSLKVFW